MINKNLVMTELYIEKRKTWMWHISGTPYK